MAGDFPTTYLARSCHSNFSTPYSYRNEICQNLASAPGNSGRKGRQQISSFTFRLASKGNEIFPEGSGEARKKHIDAQHERQLRTLEDGQRCNENQREDSGKQMGIDQRCGKSSGLRKEVQQRTPFHFPCLGDVKCRQMPEQLPKHVKPP